MKLILRNAYPYPFPSDVTKEQENAIAQTAGDHTMVIEGIADFEILHTITVEFKDYKAFKKAKELTGWEPWGGDSLVLEAKAAEGYMMGMAIRQPYSCAGVETEWTEYAGFMLVEDAR